MIGPLSAQRTLPRRMNRAPRTVPGIIIGRRGSSPTIFFVMLPAFLPAASAALPIVPGGIRIGRRTWEEKTPAFFRANRAPGDTPKAERPIRAPRLSALVRAGTLRPPYALLRTA